MDENAIYVSSSAPGDDHNPGTPTAPVKTITAGLTLAAALGDGASVNVTIGRYDEPIVLRSGIAIRGGFKPGFAGHCPLGDADMESAERDPSKYADRCTVLHGSGDRIVVGENLAGSTTLGDVVVIANDIPAATPGGSSYAIVVSADPTATDAKLVLDGVKIVCGNGAPGKPGVERRHADGEQYVGPTARGGLPNSESGPVPAQEGPLLATAARPRNDGWPDQDYGWGGECGADAVRDGVVLVKGGQGGAAGCGDSEYTFNGNNGRPGGDGEPGRTPSPGPDGSRGDANAGRFDKGLSWVGASGNPGVDGGDGSGGGAGGAGGTHHQKYAWTAYMTAIGGRGGDGGRGGRGGWGGGGGAPGGGSFGVVSRDVRVVASRAAIALGLGGAGGRGGTGESGHPGEPGQPGGPENTTSDGAALHSNSGKGGDGKPGGNGTKGGSGAGGDGGPAIAIALIGRAVLDGDDEDLEVIGGRPGAGGEGSEHGHTGAIAETMKLAAS